jgi:putative heme iron utilization protein
MAKTPPSEDRLELADRMMAASRQDEQAVETLLSVSRTNLRAVEPLLPEPVSEEALAERLKRRFVARHPGAAVYADFADFHLYRFAVERAHLVAGFGKVHWIDGADVLFAADGAEPLAAAEAGILAHMNADHADALDLMARHLLGRAGGGWTLVGLDPEGADLRGGDGLARLPFDETVRDSGDARRVLARLAQEALQRSAAGAGEGTDSAYATIAA